MGCGYPEKVIQYLINDYQEEYGITLPFEDALCILNLFDGLCAVRRHAVSFFFSRSLALHVSQRFIRSYVRVHPLCGKKRRNCSPFPDKRTPAWQLLSKGGIL